MTFGNRIDNATDPQVFQGGMGVRISSPELAGAVARNGGLGFVSGTAIDIVLARSLQEGDKDGSIREILATFPNQSVVNKILDRYFNAGGIDYDGRGIKYSPVPMHAKDPDHIARDATVLGAYTEVMLAKKAAGDNGAIGINLLTKIEPPIVYALYGAMLADVDYIEMGAGVPSEVPAIIKKLAKHQPVSYPLKVARSGQKHFVDFDPIYYETQNIELKEPRFFAIVSKEDLAKHLAQLAIPPYGFIIENYTAGGHNAPPRGAAKDEYGQPVYTQNDMANLDAFDEIGLPYWLAGGYGGRMGLRTALAKGANGVQIGSVFALSQESGLRPDLKKAIVNLIFSEGLNIKTDSRISPTGFPFKVADLEQTIASSDVYDSRKRVCDVGHLREAVIKKSGDLDYRCPAETEAGWARKDGLVFRLGGVACLCNGLLATAGFAQVRNGIAEAPLVTLGDNVVKEALEHGQPLNVDRIMRNIQLAARIGK